ncbi:HU family DNA-binding protein [Candidatus Gracilibacteria bacterium]|nr:HU family DNA-binding protein [Candidatus Gracilibacteria bacterium]
MIKKEFVEEFSKKTGEEKEKSKKLVETFMELVGEMLEEDECLKFSNWGIFDKKETPERRVRHPKTGEFLVIKGRKVVKFHMGKKLNMKLNQKNSENKTIENNENYGKKVIKKLSSIKDKLFRKK